MKRIAACKRHRAKVFQMCRDGYSLTEIGKVVGTTRHRVLEFLRKNGVKKKFPYSYKGARCNQWKGGRLIDKDGYVLVYCPDHPNASGPGGRYVREHRLVMEKHLGRFLSRREVVHHRNDDKRDNRIQNLQLFSKNSDHLRATLAGKCPKWTETGVHRMKEGVARSANRRRTYSRPPLKSDDVRSPGIGVRRIRSLKKAVLTLLETAHPLVAVPLVSSPKLANWTRTIRELWGTPR